ncbi:hypothetical protein ACFQ1S_43045, partial [Kibdelosporangium lantanae]
RATGVDPEPAEGRVPWWTTRELAVRDDRDERAHEVTQFAQSLVGRETVEHVPEVPSLVHVR